MNTRLMEELERIIARGEPMSYCGDFCDEMIQTCMESGECNTILMSMAMCEKTVKRASDSRCGNPEFVESLRVEFEFRATAVAKALAENKIKRRKPDYSFLADGKGLFKTHFNYGGPIV